MLKPDIYFSLDHHFVIVEVDEDQHRSYNQICECARLTEIVSAIGERSIVFIRFNPDVIKNNGKVIDISILDRLNLLIDIINKELLRTFDNFEVRLLQLYYNDNYEIYQNVKYEEITNIVAI